MKIHRFYTGRINNKYGQLQLSHNVWVNDKDLVTQMIKVLKLHVGEKVILFDQTDERLYEIEKIEQINSIKLKYITDVNKKIPDKHLILFWSILKSDKNDIVIQKATELGAREFVPIVSERCDKKDLNVDRLQRIAIEAVEQCGRFDLPIIKESIPLRQAISEYKDVKMVVCEAGERAESIIQEDRLGVFVGPEGGWSNNEKEYFAELKLKYMNLNKFTLRAETACIIAVSKLLQ